MGQDNLRAAVFRSLNKTLSVGCEDRSGAVECGTIGQSKAPPCAEMEPTVHLRRGCRGLDPVPLNGVEEDEAMAFREVSEFQLLRVSRGAHKLTQMIESWSRVPGLDGRSRDITRDLLQGALDLQESLIMLEKLQEASKLTSTKKKEKPDMLEERAGHIEQIAAEKTGSGRFADSGRHNGLQVPRLSVGGSSRDCLEELKEVIRDSFRRQNLLPVSSDDEKASSSRSRRLTENIGFLGSMYEPNERREASTSAVMQSKKANAPSLIARLMGLEDAPSETIQPIRKESVKNKRLKPPRPTVDIEMPRPRNVHLREQQADPKAKTLEEIIQTMHFKGLLKSDYPRIQSRDSQSSPLRRRSGRGFAKDEGHPPIVIVKPLHLPTLERGEVRKDLHLDEIPVQEDIHLVKLMQEKRRSVQFVQQKSVQLVQEEKVLDHGRMLPKKLEREEVKSMEKTKSKLSRKAKSVDFVYQKQQGKEAAKTLRKSDVGTKSLLNRGRIEEKKDVKAIKMPVSRANTSTTLSKPDKKVSMAENNVSSLASAPRNSNQSSSVKPKSQNSTSFTKEKKTIGAKPVRHSTKAINADKKCKEEAKDDNPPCELDSVSTENGTLPTEGPPKRADQCPKPCTEDDTRKDQKVFCEVMPKISLGGKSPGLAEAAIQDLHKKITVYKPPGLEVDLTQLILSSQPFLSHAQELLNLGSQQPLCYQTTGTDKLESENARLFLDCAKEIMAHKIYQQDLLNHPMLLQAEIWVPRVCKSLDQLVEEISNGIEKLVGYSKAVDEEGINSQDTLYIRLEKDLRCKDILINAMWDVSWRTWISMEDADWVVSAVEELILSRLIEEVVMGLV